MKLVTMLTFTLSLHLVDSAAQAQPAVSGTSTDRFELRSDARTALHHFLIDWATAGAGDWPPYALPISERNEWRSQLSADEQRTWGAAVDAYGAAVGRSLLFDEALVAVRDWAAGMRSRDAVPAPEQLLAQALEEALPIYERHWWPNHDERNRRWIQTVAPTLAVVEDASIARFEAAYGGRWPDTRVPVDVMVYANAVGAYSIGGRLTISSADRGNQMPQAIEMIFHEASHTDAMEGPLRQGLSDAFEAAAIEEPDRFWHDVIFFTSGDITRLVLEDNAQPGYEHYGSFGVYRRGERWDRELPAFENHWRAFLQSRSTEPADRRRALEALVVEIQPAR